MDNYKKCLGVLNRRLIYAKIFSIVLAIGLIYLFSVVTEVKWHAIIVGIVLGLIVFCCFYMKYTIEQQALVNDIHCLEHKDTVGAMNWGRKYYAIKRLGLSGIQGGTVLAEDEEAIYQDIATYMDE
jgi:general stress protein CsbA